MNFPANFGTLRCLRVKLTHLRVFCARFSKKLLPFEVDTAVTKDVLLFKNENARYFKSMHFFAVSQFVFWTYLAEFAYSSLRDVSVEEAERRLRASMSPEMAQTARLTWWRKLNLGQNKYRNGVTLLCVTLGSGILIAVTMMSRRSVKYLTLLKGGTSVRLECYSPFWFPSRPIVAPVEHFSSRSARSLASSLPVQIKGFRMFFLLDKSGHFTNSQLFDVTAGLKRTWR